MLVVAARGVLVLLALTPLIVDHGVLFPFISGKALVIRSLVALSAVLVFAEMLRSDEFRAHVTGKLALLSRSPLALSVAAFLVALVASTIAAANPDRAFYGDVERGEGFISMAALIGFFFLAAILFEKKDWIRFLRLVLVVSVVLFVHAFWQWFHGEWRPGSFTGHAAHLGPYCFFAIAAAALVSADAVTRRGKALALSAIPIALSTMLLSQTRAALLGFAVGSLAVFTWLAVRGTGPGKGTVSASEPVRFARTRSQRASLVLLGCLVLASGIFLATRRAAVWQAIPGVSRVAAWNLQDGSTQTRLGAWEASLDALSPAASGWRRVGFGWGLENFHVPFNKHYDPTRFAYDVGWYDRSHNTLIDVVIMTGVFGLAAYLAMWASFFAAALHRARPLERQAPLLFAGVAYFVQNLVSFDSLTTYVPFFGLMAFAAATTVKPLTASTKPVTASTRSRAARQAAVAAVGVFALFSLYSLLAHTVPAYLQLRRYINLYRRTLDTQSLAEWSRLRSPYTYAQTVIRTQFLPHTRMLLRRDRRAEPLFVAAIVAMEELAQRDSLNPRHLLLLGEALDEYADVTGKAQLHRTAEAHLVRALALAPGRRHVKDVLAINRSRQGCAAPASVCYYLTLGEMVTARNRDGATLVRERLELLDPGRRPLLAAVNRLVQEAKWDSIRITRSGNSVNVTLLPVP